MSKKELTTLVGIEYNGQLENDYRYFESIADLRRILEQYDDVTGISIYSHDEEILPYEVDYNWMSYQGTKRIYIGRKHKTAKEWLTRYKTLAKKYHINSKLIKQYAAYVRFIQRYFKLPK